MCKEKEKKLQKGKADNPVTRQRRSSMQTFLSSLNCFNIGDIMGITATNPGLTNPCATASFADPVEVIEAKDDNGKYVELYHDVSKYDSIQSIFSCLPLILVNSISERKQFQTFYKRYCNENFKLYGFECATVEVAFETAVWIDNGDEEIANDTVELRKVWIPLDCALHQKIF